MMAATSTISDLKFLQRILPIEDLREFWYRNSRSTIFSTRYTLLSTYNPKKKSLLWLTISFKYCKKQITIWAWNGQVIGFLCLLIFTYLRLSIDREQSNINQEQSRGPDCISPFLSWTWIFVLDLKVHHSNSTRFIFCHSLPTLKLKS